VLSGDNILTTHLVEGFIFGTHEPLFRLAYVQYFNDVVFEKAYFTLFVLVIVQQNVLPQKYVLFKFGDKLNYFSFLLFKKILFWQKYFYFLILGMFIRSA
jgi:hypothetical protein